MAINKVVYGNNTLIDITDTTATEADVAQGVVFYKANGTRAVGTAQGGIEMDVLWTNPSPTSSFSAQTLAIDFTDYQFVMITGRWNTSEDTVYTLGVSVVEAGVTGRMYMQANSRIYRNFEIDSNGITFTSASYGTLGNQTSTNNAYCIPVKIYGVK